jgi:transcriptional regulator with XRE-family HTH domain
MSLSTSPDCRTADPLPSGGVPRAPALCRRLLHAELRRLRERSGMTGRQVAQAMGWSVAKVSRLERAEGALRGTEVRAVGELYGATPRELAVLTACAERARAPQWWQAREYRRLLPPGADDYLGMEATAAEIRVYAPESVPDLLRTDEYAVAAASLPQLVTARDATAAPAPAPETVRALIAAARRRRAVLERDAGAPRLVVVLSEAVLHRGAGDREVTRQQLRRLLEASRRPGLQLRVLPFAQGATPGLGGPFSLLAFADGAPPVVAREQLTGIDLLDDPGAVERYRSAFRGLLARAADPAASRDLLTAALNRPAPPVRARAQR